MYLNHFSIIGVLTGVAVYVFVGMVMYSPILFGKPWQSYKGLTNEDISNSGKALALSLLAGLTGVMILSVVIGFLGYNSTWQGALVGVLLAVFSVAVSFNSVVYDKEAGFDNRLRVWLIDSLNTVVSYALIGALLAIFMR
jgi:hypothetical protein